LHSLTARGSSVASAARRCFWLGVLGVSAAACGGQSVAVVTVTRPVQAVWCPTVFHAQTSGMSTPNPRVPGSFDTRVLLGRPKAAAANVAHQHGCLLRVVNQGGVLTTDGRPDRIDVDINHGIVTATGVG
jgi:hypothetical protein